MKSPQTSDIVLDIDHVSHGFGTLNVLHEVKLQIARGEIVGLVGPSGCGKSTLLRAILGTHPPLEGSVLVNGRKVEGPGRDRGMVYQRYSLFPFLTAEENVAFGPMLDRTSLPERLFNPIKHSREHKERLEEARELLISVKLEHALKHYPAEMSGGMCQRVAIAQALIMKPEILLLDEPFGALDEATREELQLMLLGLYQENLTSQARSQSPPHTILIVTHELNEAIYVSDRVVGLSQYWGWEEAGLQEPPGATIIYDSTAPVYGPGEHRDYEQFLAQRDEIRLRVFDPEHRQAPDEAVRFWKQCADGQGTGVMAP